MDLLEVCEAHWLSLEISFKPVIRSTDNVHFFRLSISIMQQWHQPGILCTFGPERLCFTSLPKMKNTWTCDELPRFIQLRRTNAFASFLEKKNTLP
jgi:hypothetical protein